MTFKRSKLKSLAIKNCFKPIWTTRLVVIAYSVCYGSICLQPVKWNNSQNLDAFVVGSYVLKLSLSNKGSFLSWRTCGVTLYLEKKTISYLGSLFYMMHLEDRELKFSKITHHASVTQCLGSASGEEWYLGVAKSSILEATEFNDGNLKTSIQSKCGHNYVPPHPGKVYMFRVTGTKFLKLNRGTWHAGPLFKRKTMDFYNLELSDTNIVDHTTHDFLKNDGVVFLAEEDC